MDTPKALPEVGTNRFSVQSLCLCVSVVDYFLRRQRTQRLHREEVKKLFNALNK